MRDNPTCCNMTAIEDFLCYDSILQVYTTLAVSLTYCCVGGDTAKRIGGPECDIIATINCQ